MQKGPLCVRPEELYELRSLCQILATSPTSFKERWIFSGKMDHIHDGNNFVIPGWAVIKAYEEELTQWQRNSKSKSSESAGESDTSCDGSRTGDGRRGKPILEFDTKPSAKRSRSKKS
jgi:hypothetical protein